MRLPHAALVLLALAAAAAAACDDPEPGPPRPVVDPIVTRAELESGAFTEVVSCRGSHEHELHYVRTVANAAAAELFRRCVLEDGEGCDAPFPEGAVFVKYEYELEGCDPKELVQLTANKKLPIGSYAAGHDWQWQRLTPRMEVVEDGAPIMCLLCHIDHCSPPDGHDLRCLPD